MAVYALIDGAAPVRNGVAVGSAPQARATGGVAVNARYEAVPLANAEAARLDPRYKTGATNGWERPGSALA